MFDWVNFIIGERISVGWERWNTFWPEADALARDHFQEVEGDLALKRPYAPDHLAMEKMNENLSLWVCSARIDNMLVGYLTWSIAPDIESKNIISANQGAMFVSPKASKHNIGMKMIKFSLRELPKMGVKCAFLHHRLLGRGERLGSVFKRLGGVPIKHEYMLWLGE